jgi:hypothetical protein
MAAATTAATPTCSSSSSSPIHSAGPHHRRRQLTDIERDAPNDAADSYCAGAGDDDDDLHGHGGGRQQPLLLARRKRAWAAAGWQARAWMRAVVLCLLGLVAVVGFSGSHRGGGGAGTTNAAAGGDDVYDGGRLLQRVEVADADAMGWTEENLKALARRPPEPSVRFITRRHMSFYSYYRDHPSSRVLTN